MSSLQVPPYEAPEEAVSLCEHDPDEIPCKECDMTPEQTDYEFVKKLGELSLYEEQMELLAERDKARDAKVAARARQQAFEMLEPLYRDGHQWSRRPCSTCQTVSERFGQDFGCIRYAKAKSSSPEGK